MNFGQADRLLDPAPMALEMGFERLPDGVLHVAIRTDMRDCCGAMLNWWFGSRPQTREYRWWHPLDHLFSAWTDGQPGQMPGAVHLVEERFTNAPAEKLTIQFRDPTEVFSAQAAGHAACVLLARGGAGHEARRDPSGAVIGARLIHLGRDTGWGLVLRTHFFLGQDLPGLGVPAAELERIFPDAYAPNLLQHCYDEFSFLARLLPALYEAEGGAEVVPKRPW